MGKHTSFINVTQTFEPINIKMQRFESISGKLLNINLAETTPMILAIYIKLLEHPNE